MAVALMALVELRLVVAEMVADLIPWLLARASYSHRTWTRYLVCVSVVSMRDPWGYFLSSSLYTTPIGLFSAPRV